MTEQKQSKEPSTKGSVELSEDALDQAAGGAKAAVDHKEWLQVTAKETTLSQQTSGNGI